MRDYTRNETPTEEMTKSEYLGSALYRLGFEKSPLEIYSSGSGFPFVSGANATARTPAR
jgi:hypothetical protein